MPPKKGKDTNAAKPHRIRWATYLPEETVEQIRRAAYSLRMTTGEVVEVAVQGFVQKEEKKHGEPFGPVKELQRGKRIR